MNWLEKWLCDHRFLDAIETVTTVKRGLVSGLRWEHRTGFRTCDFCGKRMEVFSRWVSVEDQEYKDSVIQRMTNEIAKPPTTQTEGTE